MIFRLNSKPLSLPTTKSKLLPTKHKNFRKSDDFQKIGDHGLPAPPGATPLQGIEVHCVPIILANGEAPFLGYHL